MSDFASEFDSVKLPAVVTAPVRTWALVEVFGHRQHYGEIREVEAFGAKLLEVNDADTGRTHRYGGTAIFSLTMLTQAEFDEHLEAVKRRKERETQWQIECEKRRKERETINDVEEEPF